MMRVEVAYALPEEQVVLALQVAPSCTVQEALKDSGIFAHFPELKLEQIQVGIFGRKVKLNHGLAEGDRIEIYRQLQLDPKAARRLRAKRAQRQKKE